MNERLSKTESRIRDGSLELTIITGAGHHSDNNRAKIKPAIEELLRQRGFQYEVDRTGGIILVQGSSGAASPAGEGGTAPRAADDSFVTFLHLMMDMVACCFAGSRSKN